MDGDGRTTSAAAPTASSPSEGIGRIIRKRTANACDGCKARKSKCDGKRPCSYCLRRQCPDECRYTPRPGHHVRESLQEHQRRRTLANRGDAVDKSNGSAQLPQSPPPSAATGRSTRGGSLENPPRQQKPQQQQTQDEAEDQDSANRSTRWQSVVGIGSAEDDTEVPRDARLLCDAQGKLIFIGDCAPLSFFQSVRQLVTHRVGPNAFAPETSRYSVLENAPGSQSATQGNLFGGSNSSNNDNGPPKVRPQDVAPAIASYKATTTGLIDLFDESTLTDDILLWANMDRKPQNLTSAINYTILAIGRLRDDEQSAQIYFEHAKSQALGSLGGGGDLGVGTVQAFLLVTVYMLCSCQINSSFLILGIAARAAYSIGLHRTEVNARFGPETQRQRDRLWKSLRVVDLFLSTSMGRPPAISDVDCTVPYRALDGDGNEVFDLLNASVQILLVMEGIVNEIYSRRKVSLQLTEGISIQLREWSTRWLQRLKHVVDQPSDHSQSQVCGACQVLSSYYYAVMLVSRPFLMYEMHTRLAEPSEPAVRHAALTSGKSKLADACIDAASLLVDPILDLLEQGALSARLPLLVSWLFASSLVLGLGLLGGFGRILEKYTRMSIRALDHFALSDAHATQYSLIAQSLLTTALEQLEQREMQERLRRTQSSNQLFGLIPHGASTTSSPSSSAGGSRWGIRHIAASPRQNLGAHTTGAAGSPGISAYRSRDSLERPYLHQSGSMTGSSPRTGGIDFALHGQSDSFFGGQDGDLWSAFQGGSEADPGLALNLFPLLDAGGGIDLAHYL